MILARGNEIFFLDQVDNVAHFHADELLAELPVDGRSLRFSDSACRRFRRVFPLRCGDFIHYFAGSSCSSGQTTCLLMTFHLRAGLSLLEAAIFVKIADLLDPWQTVAFLDAILCR